MLRTIKLRLALQIQPIFALVPRFSSSENAYYSLLLLSVLLTAALCTVLYLWFPHFGFVRELTSIGGSFYDTDKIRDIYVPLVALFIQIILIFAILRRVGEERLRRYFERHETYKGAYFIFSLVCLLVVIAAIARGRLIDLAFLTLIIAAGAAAYASFRERWAAAFSIAFTVACLVAWTANHVGILNVRAVLIPTLLAACIALGALRRRTRLLKLSYATASIVAAIVAGSNAPIFWLPRPIHPSLTIMDGLVLSASAIAMVQVVRWFMASDGRRLAPVPLFPLALAFGLVGLLEVNPLILPGDDYHFGEKLLASRAIWDGGLFDTFFTAHGLSDAIGGFGAFLLGDQTTSAIITGEFFGLLFILLLLAWQLFRLCGPLCGVLLLICMPMQIAFLLPALMIIAIIRTAALKSDLLFGAALCLVSAIAVFLINGIGVAIALPSAFMALVLFRPWNPWGMAKAVASSAVCGLVLLLLFHRQMAGQIFFLSASAETNLFVYGNNFVPSASRISRVFGLAGTLMFLAVPTLAFALASQPKPGPRTWSDLWRPAIAIVPPLMLACLFIPYAMGRLDVDIIRGYTATLFALILMILWLRAPLLQPVFTQGRQAAIALAPGCFALLLLLAAPLPIPLLLQNWARASLMPPATAPTVVERTLPALRGMDEHPQHRSLVASVQQVVDGMLQPGETYLDLSNRNALYFYLDRPAPVAISSVYNAAPRAFQDLNISMLRKQAPALAVVSADNIEHDGYGLPLRAFEIYRYLLENYRPFRNGTFIYGIRPDLQARIQKLAPGDASDLDLWAEAFPRTDLGRLPSAWGRSLGLLKNQMRAEVVTLQLGASHSVEPLPAGRYKITGPSPSWTYALPPDTKPAQDGLLALDIACSGRAPAPHVEVHWRGPGEDFSAGRTMTFEASFPKNLVPLDAAPRWFLAPSIAEIRITIDPPAGCGDVILNDMRLMGRA